VGCSRRRKSGPENTYIESGGDPGNASFEVNGAVLKLRAEGETESLQFKITDKNSIAMDVGLVEIPFKCVR
jgi:hypothetical protein